MAIRISDAYKPGYNRVNLDLIGKSAPPDAANKVGSAVLNQAMAEILNMRSTAQAAIPVITSAPLTVDVAPILYGIPYTYTFTGTSLAGALTWSVASGTLPSGLTLNPTTGLLSGTHTPAAGAATYNFTIRASAGGAYLDQVQNLRYIQPGRSEPWQLINTPSLTAGLNWKGVAYCPRQGLANGAYAAFAMVSDGVTGDIAESFDGGLTWVQKSWGANFDCIAGHPQYFLALAQSIPQARPMVFTWAPRGGGGTQGWGPAGSGPFYAACWVPYWGAWVAVGTRVMTSGDASTWTLQSVTFDGPMRCVATNGTSVVVALGDGGAGLWYATSSANAWTKATTSGANFKSVIWTGTRFVALNSGGGSWTSTDGINWSVSGGTYQGYGLAWTGAQVFSMVSNGSNGRSAISDTGASTWADYALPAGCDHPWYGIADGVYGGIRRWVAVAPSAANDTVLLCK